MTLRIAMWSGPRNLSTAMMRAWENRGDCAVTDEPLYAYYLARTGLDHPMAAEVIRSQSADWREVTNWLSSGPIPGGARIWYQKHMTHHLLAEVDRRWMDGLTHCFLIREPALVAASYARAREQVTLDDLGYAQQAELFAYLTRQQGQRPLVVSSRDLLEHPRPVLSALCERLGVAFSESMLHWPAGLRPSDGVWAKHWYRNVEHSTGFEPYQHREPKLSEPLHTIVQQAEPFYRELHQHRLRPR
jgi:hypothetical protein